MSIVDTYKTHFSKGNEDNMYSDFYLASYSDNAYVGLAHSGEVVVAVESESASQSSVGRRTRMISVECNMNVTYLLQGNEREGIFHIIKCYSTDQEEIYLFLELAALLISEGEATKEHILYTFQTLAVFFADKEEPSDNELIGLYGELYTIKSFTSELELENYWQSRDKLKFDFSITDDVKIEVKTTTRAQRSHHFKHDQLATSMYSIWIVSYMIRHDDEGLSLLELINICKPMLENKSKNLAKVNKILKNVDHNRLASIRFDEKLTKSQMRIYRGEDAPKFNEVRPDGVSNAEYDCNFEQTDSISVNEFVKTIQNVQMQDTQSV